MQAPPRGFTLIELMVALAIIALLLLLGMPSFTTFLRNSEVRSTSESLINGLRAASAEAARQNQKVVFTLVGGSGDASWSINFKDPDTGKLVQPPIQQYSHLEAGRSSKVAPKPNDKLSVTFTGLGRIENQGTPDDHLQWIDIDSIDGQARRLSIIVDDVDAADPSKPRGLRMCDPDPDLAKLNDPRAC